MNHEYIRFQRFIRATAKKRMDVSIPMIADYSNSFSAHGFLNMPN